eukprot:13356-Heterococcus_DN1.PRE.2
MARTKNTARPSSYRLWPQSGSSYFVLPRRALRYVEDEHRAKAACHSMTGAFAQAGDLLRKPVILQEVCKYLIGHSLYVSLVCKAWKHCYEVAAAESELAVVVDIVGKVTERVGALHVTLYRAVFASAATVEYANEDYLDLNSNGMTRSAGKHGSLDAVARFYELDGRWDGNLTIGAAARGDVKLLQFLLLNDCSYDVRKLADAVGRGGSVELFTWLLESGKVTNEQWCEDSSNIQSSRLITNTLIAAVKAGHLHMCKHLLQLQANRGLTVATELVAYAAAKTRNKQLLQWLQTDSGLTVNEALLFQFATDVPKQDLATVLWLLEQGYALPTDCYTGMLLFENCNFLLEVTWGAVWPDQLGHTSLNRCWCAAAVAWARAEGCAAPVLAVEPDIGADGGDH